MTVSDPLRRHAGPAARYRWLVLGLALVAAAWKLDVAATTAGTNDVIHWAQFGAGVRRVGPIDVYSLRFPIVYNHPPLIGWMLVLMTWLADHGLPFRFTVRVPAVAANVLTSLLVFEIIRVRRSLQQATAAGILVGCSPVLFVISGFHGNTDPVFVCLAVLSAYLLVDRRLPVAAGLCLGAALSVKLVPIVAAPALLVGAARQGRLRRFVGGTAVIFLLVWTGPVLYQWHAFRRDVLGYAGFDPFRQWGLTRLAVWARASPHVIELWRGPGRFLVLLVCAAVPALLAWRRLADTPLAVGSSLAIFLLLSPTFATQYLVWPVAGLALLGFFGGAAYNLLAGALVVATYNRWAGGFPWNLALARKLDAGEVRLAAVVWLALLLAVVVGGVRSLRRPPDRADRKGGRTRAGPTPLAVATVQDREEAGRGSPRDGWQRRSRSQIA